MAEPSDPSAIQNPKSKIQNAEILDGLAALLDNSLLQQEAATGEPRFRMLETIREYGLERLVESGERDAIRKQHAAFFLALVEECPGDDRLETEHDNLRAALAWSLETGEAELGLRLGTRLNWFWSVRGHLTEGRERLAALQALPEAATRAATYAGALDAAG